MTDRSIIEHEFQPDLTGPADPYRRLGVSRDATAADIKRAYRKIAQKFHPDKGGDKVLFQELKLCYETLIDPVRRAQYDATGLLQEKPPDTAHSDALSALVSAFERTLQALIQSKTEPRHVNMVQRIKVMLDVMDDELFREEQQIKASLPEWESIVKRFKVKSGENVFAHHITGKVSQFRQRLDQLSRHKKAVKIAKEMIQNYSFDWEQPDRFEQNMQNMNAFTFATS